jgi:hypothetical protein
MHDLGYNRDRIRQGQFSSKKTSISQSSDKSEHQSNRNSTIVDHISEILQDNWDKDTSLEADRSEDNISASPNDSVIEIRHLKPNNTIDLKPKLKKSEDMPMKNSSNLTTKESSDKSEIASIIDETAFFIKKLGNPSFVSQRWRKPLFNASQPIKPKHYKHINADKLKFKKAVSYGNQHWVKRILNVRKFYRTKTNFTNYQTNAVSQNSWRFPIKSKMSALKVQSVGKSELFKHKSVNALLAGVQKQLNKGKQPINKLALYWSRNSSGNEVGYRKEASCPFGVDRNIFNLNFTPQQSGIGRLDSLKGLIIFV